MLASLADFKSMLGITTNARDAQLNLFLTSADAAVKAYCQQAFEPADYIEYHTGNNTRRIALRQLPVRSVTYVRLDADGYFGDGPDPAFDTVNTLVEGEDWVLDKSPGQDVSKSGILYRIGSVWPMHQRIAIRGDLTVERGPNPGNLKVSYSAGYLSIPRDLQYATLLLASWMRQTFPHGGMPLKSERIGDYSYTLGDAGLERDPALGSLRTTLAPYKQMGW